MWRFRGESTALLAVVSGSASNDSHAPDAVFRRRTLEEDLRDSADSRDCNDCLGKDATRYVNSSPLWGLYAR